MPLLLAAIGLTLLAALSPMLTLLRLWQLKEWRWDRLREHLRAEGWMTALWGRLRPAIVVATFIGYLFFPLFLRESIFLSLALLAFLTLLQILLGRQRFPVWTRKTYILATGSTAFTLILATLLLPPSLSAGFFLPVLVLLQPLTIGLAWLLFLPIDRRMKANVFRAAKRLRDAHKDRLVIAIAGSVGKTTTKELIGAVLQDKHALVTPEHVNTEMGVAQWMLRTLGKEADAGGPIVIEMGAYAQGEIALLCSFVQPQIGVITALGSDHLALFGSESAIVDANGELVASLPTDGHAFIQTATEGGRILADRATCAVTRISQGDDTHEGAEAITETDDGLSFTNRGTRFAAPLHGKHHVLNLLTAIAVGRHLGIADQTIAKHLQTLRKPENTFAFKKEHGVTLVNDTYNASRLSMTAALAWANARPERPRILLTAGLMELGREESTILKEMGRLAMGTVERVVFTTDAGRKAFEEGFGSPVELLRNDTTKITQGSLILCIGRMPASCISRLLP